MKVLVAYATKYGSTQGVAERIAATLTADGQDVDIAMIGAPGDLAPYDAFVIGSGIFGFHWMKPAARFLRERREILTRRPVWLFSVGPLGPKQAHPLKPRDYNENSEAVDARGHAIFYGAMNVLRLKGADRLMGAMFKSMQGDFRDWEAIESWAHSIARELAPRPVPAG
ncbi:MAG: flavodoxin domain-containing protein [Candidatus Dormibacterales bacterium]